MFSLHFKQKQKMHDEQNANKLKLEELKEQVIQEEFGNFLGN